MTNYQIERIKKFFGMEKNKQRLIKLLKSEGEYLEFIEKKGYIYAVKIGEAEGKDVMLKVAMLNGKFEIMNAFTRQQVSIETA
jgi:hypothetical protein